jgi:hypothetical protein
MTHRLDAVRKLVEHLESSENLPAFFLNEHIEFAFSQESGVYLHTKAPIDRVEQDLVVLPSLEAISYEALVEEGCQIETETGDRIPFKLIMDEIHLQSREIPTTNAETVVLTTLVLYLLTHETRFDNTLKTWPSREDLQTAFTRQALDNYVVIQKQKEDGIYYEVLLPVLAKFQVCLGNRQDFDYAFNLVQSRCYWDGISAVIIPLLDLINGLPECNRNINASVSRAYEYDREGVVKECFSVVNTRPLGSGEQIFISYGDISPQSFLYKYGVFPDVYPDELRKLQ